VTILEDLEGPHIHQVELDVVSAFVMYHLVGEYTPAIGDRVARAFRVKGDHLRGSLVILVDGEYSRLVYAVRFLLFAKGFLSVVSRIVFSDLSPIAK